MTEHNRNRIYEKRPAHPMYERWKDATPLGNGETGALVFGDVGKERIRFTRADVWEGGVDVPVPDVSETLAAVRADMDSGNYEEANTLLFRALQEKHYTPGLSSQFPIGDLTLAFSYAADCFSDYRRILYMDTAHCEVCYRMGENPVVRSAFLSRDDGLFHMRITAESPVSVCITPTLPETDVPRQDAYSRFADGASLKSERTVRDGVCGLLTKVTETDGAVTVTDEGITVSGFTSLSLVVRTYMGTASVSDFPVCGYDAAFARHTETYGTLYNRADISFADSDGTDFSKSNEELLLDAFSGGASALTLYEKLWRFGRYLYISGVKNTDNAAYPFPLYGLWTGDYNLPWAQHVANENVQIIHWHALAGNLPELLLPLIRYYYRKIPAFRENARALFGCRGIVVSAYTTPYNSHINPPVPVILNFTMASGWLCRHFFDYYDWTGDEKTLTEMILPFALETAQFIEDFAVIRDGALLWYPSVSPENSPRSFINKNPMMHAMPTTENATIELAIVKETLTRLCAVAETHGLYAEKIPQWKRICNAVPRYEVNEDGAVREWQAKEFADFYCHRHLSHIYPVFPGNEVTRTSDPFLWKAFEKAVDLRELGGQSGWSFAHMAGIYARLGRGDDMLGCLSYLCRACLCDNFFTIHNDWRENHLTLEMKNPPVQLDALMGVVNALQQMLLDDDGKTLHLFGALPTAIRRGTARGLAFRFGTVSLSWDADKDIYSAEILASRDGTVTVDSPKNGYRACTLDLKKGQSYPLAF